MTDTNERMTDEQTFWYQCQERAMAPGIGDGWPEVILAPHTPNARLKRMDGDPTKTITQLRTDLAAANERAEKAEELGNAHTEYTNRVLAERDTLRSENAAMREGLEDFKKHGTRHDASPTQASPWSNERWYEYCRSMDSRVREMAADTLARLTTQEGGEG